MTEKYYSPEEDFEDLILYWIADMHRMLDRSDAAIKELKSCSSDEFIVDSFGNKIKEYPKRDGPIIENCTFKRGKYSCEA